jgi:hypothetical protein
MNQKRIVRSATDYLTRIHGARLQVASDMDMSSAKLHFERLSKPKSPSSTLKKAGVALIVGTPDPITAVPGVALIVASVAMKKKEPAKLDDLANETRKIIRDLESLSL